MRPATKNAEWLSGFNTLWLYISGMKMTDSQRLLAEYARTGAEEPFQELLTRYLDLVYSTAVRLTNHDADLAKDVSQTVFIALARKASKLPSDVMLGGWLHRHTVFVASTVMRAERRRQQRERYAAEMNAQPDHTQANLALVTPVLDEAIDQLGEDERSAILLRFFEQLDLRSVGEALGSTEEAARKRVSRALEKLHSALQNKGVSLSIATLGSFLATESVKAAPAGLAVSIAGATTFLKVTTLGKIASMAKIKLAVISAVLLAGVATPLLIQHKAASRLREKDDALLRQADQIAQLVAENGQLSNRMAQTASAPSESLQQLSELLRLRGEVAMLRQQTDELAKLQHQNQKLLAQIDAQSGTNDLSAEDRFALRETHAVQATTTLLQAIKIFATNHGGVYPEDFRQLTASGELKSATFPSDMGINDFDLKKDGAVDAEGNAIILSLRSPIPKPGGGAVMIYGGIDENGVVFHTASIIVNPELGMPLSHPEQASQQ